MPLRAPWQRRLTWAAGSLLALLALWQWALPPLVAWLVVKQLPPRLSQALGRPVSLAQVEFQPWRLALTLHGLQVGGAAGAVDAPTTTAASPPLLQVARVHAVLSLASLRHLAPVVDALQLQSPRLRLTRTAAGHYDIDDLLARLQSRPAGAEPDTPARFALYNLELLDGELLFDDRPAAAQHRVQALSVGLPFLSNLPVHRQVRTSPRLQFRLNGSAITSQAQARPFAADRDAELSLTVTDLALKPWLGYLPEALPVRLQQGRLSGQLRLVFSQAPQGEPKASLQGELSLSDLVVAEASGAALLSWQSLVVGLDELQPLRRRLVLSKLELTGARLQLQRESDGRFNLQRLAAAFPSTPTPTPTSKQAPASTPVAPAPPWQISLGRVRLDDAWLGFADRSRPQTTDYALSGLSLKAGPLHWPVQGTAPLSLSATLRHGLTEAADAIGALELQGQASDRAASLNISLTKLDLAGLQPYLADLLTGRLQGQLSAQARLDWAADANKPSLLLTLDQAQLEQLRLQQTGIGADPAGPALAVQRVLLRKGELDLNRRQLRLAQLSLSQPRLRLQVDAQGRLSTQDWLAQPAVMPRQPPAPARSGPEWTLKLDELAIDGGGLAFSDHAVTPAAPPMQLAVAGLKLRLRQLAWPASAGQLLPLQVQARLGAPVAAGLPAGRLSWDGQIGLAPLQAQGQWRAERLPLQLASPYLAQALPGLLLLRAEAGGRGAVKARQAKGAWQLEGQADLHIDDLLLHSQGQATTTATASVTRPSSSATTTKALAVPDASRSGEELLSWQNLSLAGLRFAQSPDSRPRLQVQEAVLEDFYSRLNITEDGRFNLSNMAAAGAASAATAARAATAATATAATTATSPSATAKPITEPALDIDIASTRLVNGRVDFSDHFVRPNYSARLSELQGQIGRIRSGTREMAEIQISGRAADTALLTISGRLNPTAQPLALDIRARATDLELAPLSPYAGKYAGYAIERGKLSMDVAYKIDADGKLDASNQAVLNQLSFGEPVASPEATKLPVLLAVALLKDRHGVIDINLPISGSLDDPQFSVGGLIWKVIGNLLLKALTAPFALLAGGGSDDLSLVEFVPGSAQISAPGLATLAKVATALTDRPALHMTVAGVADPVSERLALQQAGLEARLQTEQRREQRRAAGGAAASASTAGTALGAPTSASAPLASADPPAPPPLTAPERERLLRALYAQQAPVEKPRDDKGRPREPTLAEMDLQLSASTPADADAMRDLALQRGLAVRDALMRQGLPSTRLFLAAPALRQADAQTQAQTSGWRPQVKLTLSTR